MSDWGLKASLPGYDVMTATPEQCAVHSSYSSLMAKSGQTPTHAGNVTVTFVNNPPSATDTTLYTIAHGYSYTPMVLCSGRFNDGLSELAGTLPLEPTATLSIFATADATNVYIKINRDAAWGSIIGNILLVSYYIFAQTGA